jgi:amidohydrolase
MNQLDDFKARVCAAIDDRRDLLVGVSHELHANPELAFDEHHAHQVLTDALEAEGISVERGAYGLPTAFVARKGTGTPTVAILCEYDALPQIGHACGHNIIASAGLGAGLALAEVVEEAGGSVVVMGTPAEEGGGGKVIMIDAGAFDGIDAAMMVHPGGLDIAAMTTIAVHPCTVEYFGDASHASAAPEKGRNALDGAILGYNAVAALRQHIASDERIHGIISHGGDKPNIVPKYAAADWLVRSPDLASLAILKDRFTKVLQGAADAALCEMSITWNDTPYSDMIDSHTMIGAYAANASTLGRTAPIPDGHNSIMGSTDMGNVSYEVPSIHPMIKVAPDEVAIHTPEFERYAGESSGDEGVIDGAKMMAMTAIDLWLDPSVMAATQAEFARSVP